ncbi:CLUMA_CG009184, isoform A [Clunio marinus]|uniref:CLUMA_CG009184, isoform A n=1 Tax=Clunio marinus TaxID=568069 RepID=A0A1J1I5X1_9DIPT|nr:CLUMA_CG009184, isoform A [Clunio marinus]
MDFAREDKILTNSSINCQPFSQKSESLRKIGLHTGHYNLANSYESILLHIFIAATSSSDKKESHAERPEKELNSIK